MKIIKRNTVNPTLDEYVSMYNRKRFCGASVTFVNNKPIEIEFRAHLNGNYSCLEFARYYPKSGHLCFLHEYDKDINAELLKLAEEWEEKYLTKEIQVYYPDKVRSE